MMNAASIKAHQDDAMTAALGTELTDMCQRLDGFRGERVSYRYAECFYPMPSRGAV